MKYCSPRLSWTFKFSTENSHVSPLRLSAKPPKQKGQWMCSNFHVSKTPYKLPCKASSFIQARKYTSVHALLESDFPKNPSPTCHCSVALLPIHSPVWRLGLEVADCSQASFDEVLEIGCCSATGTDLTFDPTAASHSTLLHKNRTRRHIRPYPTKNPHPFQEKTTLPGSHSTLPQTSHP